MRRTVITLALLLTVTQIADVHAQVPNPMNDAKKELAKEINAGLGSLYNAIGGYTRQLKDAIFGDGRYEALEPRPDRDENLLQSSEIAHQGPFGGYVLEGALGHHYVAYPAAYGEVYISFQVTGNATLVVATRMRNEYHVIISAGEPGNYTLTATVHRMRVDTNANVVDNPFNLAWQTEVRRRRPLPCEPPTQELTACEASCSTSDGNWCVRKRTRVDGSSCYACESYYRRSSSSSSSSSERSSSSSLPAECVPPSTEYMDCRNNCPLDTTCAYVGGTSRNKACYICDRSSSSSSREAVSSSSSSESSRSSSSDSSSSQSSESSPSSPSSSSSSSSSEENRCANNLRPYYDCNANCPARCVFTELSPDRSQQCYRCPQTTDTGDDNGGGETGGIRVNGGGTGGEQSSASSEASKSCSEECGARGMYEGTDHTSYIEAALQQYSCVSGANITIQTATVGSCTCSQRPNIVVDQTPPVCKGTVCGDVTCGQSTECVSGDTEYAVNCKWNGWRNIGENQFEPVVGE